MSRCSPGTATAAFRSSSSTSWPGSSPPCARFTYLFAPNINSYKRYQPGSFAPTAVKWGRDNRTCALRVIGHGESLRFENRVPGGDVNPYLAVAGLIAAGLHGVENELPLEDPFAGNAYEADAETVPATLAEAARLWQDSPIARSAFGDEVVDHYANNARVELAAFDAAVTDWERIRGFERHVITMPAHDVINPATEQVVARVELLDAEQTDAAITRARAAFAGWRDVAPGDRARLLRRFAEAVDADREHLAQLEVANCRATRSATPAGRPATPAT